MAKIARPEIEIEELTGEGSGILKKNALLYGKELGAHCRMYTEVHSWLPVRYRLPHQPYS